MQRQANGEVEVLQQIIMQMHSQNKFRKSEGKLTTLEDIFQPTVKRHFRTTTGYQSTACLDFSSFRTTVSHPASELVLPPEPSFKKPSNHLKQQLSSLQEKITKAKQNMKLQSSNSQGKEKRKQHIDLNSPKEVPQESKKCDLIKLQQGGIHKFTNAMQKPKNVTSFILNPYTSGKNNKYYITEAVRARHQRNSLAVEHISASISILNSCKTFLYELSQHQKQAIVIPKPLKKSPTKTLILDLDETLIHCYENAECQPDLTLSIQIDKQLVQVSFAIRPYALTFLKKMAKKWEIVIFTASHQDYANAILDELDPDGIIFSHRLYRQHCTIINDMYVKDLSRINRNLKDTVLVDNAAYSYCMQLSNGIPILPFYDGKDYELSALESYLEKLYCCEDVRQMNAEYFQLHRYTEFQTAKELINELYLKDFIR